MQFYVPDWDDRVDPGYDFSTDRFSLQRNAAKDDKYAHELFDESPYDGVLVSRNALGESGPKRELVERYGMRSYLRLPSSLRLLGDCGAYGYVRLKDPCFETGDVADYYQHLGFDLGVSIDHLVVPEFEDQRDYRYQLTLKNAEEFLALHRQAGYSFTPIGAVQGWDTFSYLEAARAVVQMGYDYVALGGLARSNTRDIAEVVGAIREALPSHIRVHVFGVARLALLPLFLELGIESVDSAAPIRQAWLSAQDNYYTRTRTYAAIRIPAIAEERGKSQTLVGRSEASFEDLQAAEQTALEQVRDYDRGKCTIEDALSAVMLLDHLLANRRDGQTSERRQRLYRETLSDQPWKRCKCPICRDLGIEVIIFRGNNRNRRRGFHNLWMVRERMKHLSATQSRSTTPILKPSSTRAAHTKPLPLVFP
jgi:hypothetical protein